MRMLRLLSSLVALCLILGPGLLAAQEDPAAGQHGAVWNLGKLDNGKRYPTTVSATNKNCRGKRTFEIEVSGEIDQFLKITGPKKLEKIGRGQTKTTPAVVDLVNAKPGQYEGLIKVHCLDCAAACHQDYTNLTVLLQVVGPAAAPTEQPAAVDESPKETPGSSPYYDDDDDGPLQEPDVPKLHLDPQPGDGLDSAVDDSDAVQVLDRPVGQSHTRRTPLPEGEWTGATGASEATPVAADTETSTVCPKALDPCAELLKKAQALEEEAATARARARALAEDQDWQDSQAGMDEEEASSDEAYAKKLRDQARQWRELADSARESEVTNLRRAGEYPPGSKYNLDWKAEARRDAETVGRREKRAQELDAQADALEKGSKAKRDKAEARRRQAEEAQQEADTKTEAADAARKAYEDCVEKARQTCEQQRSEPKITSGGGTSAGPGPSTGTTGGSGSTSGGSSGGTTPTGPTVAPPPPVLPAYKSQPAKLSKVCDWVEYELPVDEVVSSVQVRKVHAFDDPSIIELQQTGAWRLKKTFKYHCVQAGSALITVSTATNKRFKFRVGCVD